LLEQGWEVSALDDLLTRSEANVFHLSQNPYFQLAVESVFSPSVVSELVHKAERRASTAPADSGSTWPRTALA
jgi:hypothetical protein